MVRSISIGSKGDKEMENVQTHGGLMDDIYRYQRRIYDFTRKYYLLGRDRLITDLNPAPNAHILEIACGTGRNLDLITRRYPGRACYGLDISSQMLETASAKLERRAVLMRADACDFDPAKLFNRAEFDHIVLSYSLSMIPNWTAALQEAVSHLAPGGTLHIVDFGDQAQLPLWFGSLLRKWLERFHVSPRDDLKAALDELASGRPVKVDHQPLYRNYAQIARVHRPRNIR